MERLILGRHTVRPLLQLALLLACSLLLVAASAQPDGTDSGTTGGDEKPAGDLPPGTVDAGGRTLVVVRGELPPDVLDVVVSAESAVLFRLSPEWERVGDGHTQLKWHRDVLGRRASDTVDLASSVPFSWPIVSMRTVEKGPLLGKLQETVLATRYWRYPPRQAAIKMCGGFKPSVAIRFRNSWTHVDTMLCFDCDEMSIRSRGYERTIDASLSRPALLGLARKLFPDDPAFGAD